MSKVVVTIGFMQILLPSPQGVPELLKTLAKGAVLSGWRGHSESVVTLSGDELRLTMEILPASVALRSAGGGTVEVANKPAKAAKAAARRPAAKALPRGAEPLRLELWSREGGGK